MKDNYLGFDIGDICITLQKEKDYEKVIPKGTTFEITSFAEYVLKSNKNQYFVVGKTNNGDIVRTNVKNIKLYKDEV